MQETNFENITNTEDNTSVDLTKSNVKRKNVNIVRFTGVIINRNSNKKYTSITISCRDYTAPRTENGRYKCHTPTIRFFGEEGVELYEKFNDYDHVTIEAIVQNTFNHKTKVNRQELWGISMKATENKLSLASGGIVSGSSYPDDENFVYISGKISNVYAYGNGWISLAVTTVLRDDNGKPTYRSQNVISYYSRNVSADLEKLVKNKTIDLIARVETSYDSKKRMRFETVFMTDYVVS